MYKPFQPLSQLTLALSLTLVLSACGGGGGGGITTPPVTELPVVDESLDDAFALYLTDLADQFILPAYSEIQHRAEQLHSQSVSFCALSSANNSDLQSFKDSWLALNQSWQSIQWLKLGPVLEDSRQLRIQFWEPGTNAVSNGVKALLLRQGETINAELISGINVGAQGIPALEYLLYPSSSNDSLLNASNKAKRCEVAQAIAKNLTNITSDITAEWSTSGGDYRNTFISGTDEFTSIQDVVEELVTLWLEHINIVKDDKVLAPLGDNSPGSAAHAEHSLSDVSLASIQINLNSYLNIYTAGGGQGFDDILATTLEQQSIADQVAADISAITTRLEALSATHNTLTTAIRNETGRAELTTLIEELNTLRNVLTIEFIQALDISTGFNATDGD